MRFKKKEENKKAYPNSLSNVIQIDDVTGYPFPPKQVAEEFIDHYLEKESKSYAYHGAFWLAELYESQSLKRNKWYWIRVKQFIKEMTPDVKPKQYKTIVNK